MIAEEGPFFEDLTTGQHLGSAPTVQITDGMSAVHQSIVGNRVPCHWTSHCPEE